jgi:hypothetical protein
MSTGLTMPEHPKANLSKDSSHYLSVVFCQFHSIIFYSDRIMSLYINSSQYYEQFIQFHLLRAYDLSNNGYLNGVNVTVEFNGQIIANELTAGDWTKLAGMPDRETVTLTSILNGYHPNIQTILVDINNHYLRVGMTPNVIF